MDKVEKASRMRKTIAKNMSTSWLVSPKCDYLMKADVDPLIALRKGYNEEMGVKTSYLHYVMKAAAIALSDFPYVNSGYDSELQTHLLRSDINVGFSFVSEAGLMVANTKNSDRLDVAQLSAETARLIQATAEKRLELSDLEGGSITVNNMGPYSRLIQHSAIINQPELAILSMYAIREEAVVINGSLEVGRRMNLVLSADHRVIDGKMACDFLARIVELLEEPDALVSHKEAR